MFEKILSFDKPMGPLVTRILYYFALAAILVTAVFRIFRELWYFLNGPISALGQILIVIPITAIISGLIVRVVAEAVLALFRMDKSLHDQVTGRAAPAGSAMEAPVAQPAAKPAPATTPAPTSEAAEKVTKAPAKRTRTVKPKPTATKTEVPKAKPDADNDSGDA